MTSLKHKANFFSNFMDSRIHRAKRTQVCLPRNRMCNLGLKSFLMRNKKGPLARPFRSRPTNNTTNVLNIDVLELSRFFSISHFYRVVACGKFVKVNHRVCMWK